MSMNHKKMALNAMMMTGVLVGLGCKPAASEAPPSAADKASQQQDSAMLPAGLFLAQPPADARSVSAIRADAEATGEVVVRGRIGGRKQPFVDGAAVLVLADESVKACNELHGDGCRTPWDYCCEPHGALAAKTATIQIVGDDGKPLRTKLEGKGGLEPLSTIVVVGHIAERSTDGVLVINARGIFVHPR